MLLIYLLCKLSLLLSIWFRVTGVFTAAQFLFCHWWFVVICFDTFNSKKTNKQRFYSVRGPSAGSTSCRRLRVTGSPRPHPHVVLRYKEGWADTLSHPGGSLTGMKKSLAAAWDSFHPELLTLSEESWDVERRRCHTILPAGREVRREMQMLPQPNFAKQMNSAAVA